MSYKREDRDSFLWRVYGEMFNDAMVNARDRESAKAYFLRLVEGSEKLSKFEKQWCRERYINEFELNNAMYKIGEPRECDKCQTTRYSDKYCERCISLHLRSLFNTSGNETIDNFIRRC